MINFYKNMLFFTVLGFYSSAMGQVNNYTFSTENGSYQELVSANILATATATNELDEEIFTQTLPFSFPFNGNSYSQVHISTDGFVFFGNYIPSETDYDFKPIPKNDPFSGIIAGFNDDLIGYFLQHKNPGNISTKTIGTAPNREYVIQWKDFTRYQPPAFGGYTNGYFDVNFQIRLHENGSIKSVYNISANDSPNGKYITVGLRGASTADFAIRTNQNNPNGNWTNTIPATTISAMVFMTSSSLPASGFTFVWTPNNTQITNCHAIESFNLDFENISTLDLFTNQCWNRNNIDSPPFTITNNLNGNPLNDNALKIYKGNGINDLILVSPELTTTNGTHGISFDFESMLIVDPADFLTNQEKVVVGTMASATDFDSFTPTNFEFPIDAMGTKETTAISFPNGHKHIALKFDMQTSGNKTIIIDNIKWQTALSTKKIEPTQVKIYPNPACDILHIETDLLIKNIDLFDIAGKKILSTSQTTIDTNFLESGVYFLSIESTENSKGNFKIIVK